MGNPHAVMLVDEDAAPVHWALGLSSTALRPA
jgi:hypothetical protein